MAHERGQRFSLYWEIVRRAEDERNPLEVRVRMYEKAIDCVSLQQRGGESTPSNVVQYYGVQIAELHLDSARLYCQLGDKQNRDQHLQGCQSICDSILAQMPMKNIETMVFNIKGEAYALDVTCTLLEEKEVA